MEFVVLKGEPKKKTLWLILGVIIFLASWYLLVYFKHYKPSVLPYPHKVLMSYPELITKYHLMRHLGYSILLNILGYTEAVVASILIGYALGLCPTLRGMFEPILTASRFLPLPSILGIMTGIFGIALNMKVQFLALGIAVYLVPVVIQRIIEVPQVYLDTSLTCGASKWQAIKTVIIPETIPRIFIDIIVLIAISWTYIVIAEMINASDGGIGSMIFVSQKLQRGDMLIAVILVILFWGVFQDKMMKLIYKIRYPHNYV